LANRHWLANGVLQNHLIDPRSGRPTRSPWRDVTVAAPSCFTADVAAKAALLLGEDGPSWLDERGLPGRFVGRDGRVRPNAVWSRRAPHAHAA
jgi:thiamine biosynthesis lipoprotein